VLAQILRAAQLPIVFDEDSPQLTDAQLAEFKPVNPDARRWLA
jgi:hypothetical protein